jgi:GMP reductase
VEQWKEFAKKHPSLLPYVAVSSGTSTEDFKKLEEICSAVKVNTICVDVANGYSEHFVEFVRKVRKQYPGHTIMAGNVVTGEMVEELILSGADIVKVGIGPGSVCTTRKKTGVGYPQLSAIIECADAAHGLGGLIIADGGCTSPGDIVKAFGGGADFVMIGGMLAGHDESEGKTVEVNGKKFKEFYGMSSSTAMKKHSGKVAEYRASEGKHVQVPCRGPVSATIGDILGGLRSACTYVGAAVLKDFSKRTTFIRVTQQTNETFAALPHEALTNAEERAGAQKSQSSSNSNSSNSNSNNSGKSSTSDCDMNTDNTSEANGNGDKATETKETKKGKGSKAGKAAKSNKKAAQESKESKKDDKVESSSAMNTEESDTTSTSSKRSTSNAASGKRKRDEYSGLEQDKGVEKRTR